MPRRWCSLPDALSRIETAGAEANLRSAVRMVAHALVVLLSLGSLVNMLSRALPGGSLLPGGTPTAEQKELEEIMGELEGRPAPPPPPSEAKPRP